MQPYRGKHSYTAFCLPLKKGGKYFKVPLFKCDLGQSESLDTNRKAFAAVNFRKKRVALRLGYQYSDRRGMELYL